MGFERGFKGMDHLANRATYPALRRIDVAFFLGVLDQVEQVRRLQVVGAGIGLDLPDKVHLPVAPLGRAQLALDVVHKTFSTGLVLPAPPEIELVQAVDQAVLRQAGAGGLRQGGQQVDHMHHLVGDALRGHLAGPAHDQRHPQRALHGRVVSASPHACATPPGTPVFGTVVTGKYKDRVLVQAAGVHGVDQLADARIHLYQRIGEVAFAGSTLKLAVWQGGVVQLRQGHIKKEGPTGGCLLADKRATAVGQFGVDAPAHFEVIGFTLFGGPACVALHHMRNVHHLRIKPHLLGEHALVGGARNTIPVVKAAVLGVAALLVAQVPFAVHRRGVARLREQLGHRDFPRMDALGQARRDRLQGARAYRVAAGHERRARGHAVALHVEVQKPRALRRQRIDTWRGRAAQLASAIATEFAPAQVVGQHQNDMRRFCGCALCASG